MGGTHRTDMKKVLITGGSSGIGFAMSRHFARGGYHLLWVALTNEELDKAQARLQTEFNHTPVDTLALDLARPEAAGEVFKWTTDNGWELDVLVNNAGFGTYGPTHQVPMERELTMVNVNILATYRLTRFYLDDMLRRNAGTIINISSNSAFQPVARMNTYAATKAFVYQFSRGLQEELKLQGSKVRCITVCPSAISDTPFRNVNGLDGVRTFNGLATTTAEEVAKDVWNAFTSGRNFVITGARMRLLFGMRRLIPYGVQQWLVRRETASA
jgi:uncharacterized protein